MNDWLDYRPPRGGVAYIAGLNILAGALAVFFGDSWFMQYVCPFLLPLGVGLWLKHSWARWTMFVLLVITSALALLLCVTGSFSGRLVIRLLIAASMIYSLWEWDVYPESRGDDIDPIEY